MQTDGSDGDLLGDDVPMQVQIYRQMRAEILDGIWVGRDDFPGERGLASRFGVSTVTSRAALERLAAESLVTRSRGRGTRASHVPSPTRRRGHTSLFPPPADLPAQLTYELVSAETAVAPAEACFAFGFEPGTHLWQSVRLLKVRGRNHSVLHNVQRPEIGERHTAEQLASAPMVWILRAEGVSIGKLTRETRAVTPPPVVARTLGLRLDEPILQLVLSVYDEEETLVEWVRVFVNPAFPGPVEIRNFDSGDWSDMATGGGTTDNRG